MTGTPHIEAAPGDFAETVLMPGDPLRAQALAKNHQENQKKIVDAGAVPKLVDLLKNGATNSGAEFKARSCAATVLKDWVAINLENQTS